MAVTGHKVNANDYKEGAKSKLSKTPFVTKPENRHSTTHKYGVNQANSMVGKAHK